MKKEITGIACTVIIILISMWFLRQLGNQGKTQEATKNN